MEYKYIKKFLPELNLNYQAGDYSADAYVVPLSNLEAELAKGVEVFGDSEDIRNAAFTTSKVKGIDTHSGLLLNYKPLKSSEPVSREEITKALDSEDADFEMFSELLKRIEKNGVK